MASWGALLLLSAAFGAFLLWVHAPAALMLGPLVAAIVMSSSGRKLKLPSRPFLEIGRAHV